MAILLHGKVLKAVVEATLAREAGVHPDALRDTDPHGKIGDAADAMRALRRGSVLVEMSPREARELLALVEGFPPARPSAAAHDADRAIAALETIAACGRKERAR